MRALYGRNRSFRGGISDGLILITVTFALIHGSSSLDATGNGPSSSRSGTGNSNPSPPTPLRIQTGQHGAVPNGEKQESVRELMSEQDKAHNEYYLLAAELEDELNKGKPKYRPVLPYLKSSVVDKGQKILTKKVSLWKEKVVNRETGETEMKPFSFKKLVKHITDMMIENKNKYGELSVKWLNAAKNYADKRKQVMNAIDKNYGVAKNNGKEVKGMQQVDKEHVFAYNLIQESAQKYEGKKTGTSLALKDFSFPAEPKEMPGTVRCSLFGTAKRTTETISKPGSSTRTQKADPTRPKRHSSSLMGRNRSNSRSQATSICGSLDINKPRSPLTVKSRSTLLTEKPRSLSTVKPRLISTAKPRFPLTAKPRLPLTAKPRLPLTSKPRSPLTSKPRSPLTSKPRSPLTSKPRSPLTSKPRSSLTAHPRSPLTANPRSPLTANPQSPLTANPRSPLTAKPRSQLTPVPRSPLTPITRSAEAAISRSPLTFQPRSPVTAKPRAPLTVKTRSPLGSRILPPLPYRPKSPPSTSYGQNSLSAYIPKSVPAVGRNIPNVNFSSKPQQKKLSRLPQSQPYGSSSVFRLASGLSSKSSSVFGTKPFVNRIRGNLGSNTRAVKGSTL